MIAKVSFGSRHWSLDLALVLATCLPSNAAVRALVLAAGIVCE